MADSSHCFQPQELTLEERLQIDELCAEFDRAWRQDASPPRIEDVLSRIVDARKPALFAELLAVELEYRRKRGLIVTAGEYDDRFPSYPELIAVAFERSASQRGHDDLMDTCIATPVASAPATQSLPAASQAAKLVELIRQYQQQTESGATVSPDDWAVAHPEFAEPLRRALEGLDRLRQTAAPSTDASLRQLGDFRIVREIGRGGMGAVFEAEQLSLGRRVALKVLWFGAVSDLEAIRRFQREAETVARLHHTNIVPIFSVGSEGPVNYYAMQLIDGRSLDTVAKERRRPTDSRTVAEWGLQAAEALAHSHQRGVVHRDVKPSNLILDQDGQIWLTDFGLAKRRDDVTLSMAGALLGTPRYMSPEQASASTRAVDHRTDIYSLGATMYELATGKPVFDGTTPHGVISQILTTEPTAPKRLRPEIPRDLDTVLMKCLHKEPSQRYDSAKELADDLRAILDSRPIKARRTSPLELAQKWLTRHRKSVIWTAGSVAATLFLVLASIVVWRFYLESQASLLSLKTDAAPLVAELFTSKGQAVSRPETVPMQEPIELRPGNYQVRVSSRGFISQTYETSLDAAAKYEFNLELGSQLLMEPLDNRFGYELVRRNGVRDVISYDSHNLMIKQLAGVEITLPCSLFVTPQESPGFVWPPSTITQANRFDKFELRPWVPEQAVDVDRDGSEDLILAFRHQACIAAVSDQKGILWIASRGQDVQEPAPGTIHPQQRGIRSTVVQSPQWVADINADGVADLLVNLADIGAEPMDFYREFVDEQKTKRWIEVLSGADGTTIWRYDVPATLFARPGDAEIPYAFRWFVGYGGGSSSGVSGTVSDKKLTRRFQDSRVERTGQHVAVPDVGLLSGFKEDSILLTAGTHLQRIDLRTGAAADAVDTARLTADSPQLRDLDGDGRDEVLLVEQLPTKTYPALNRFVSDIPQVRISAWSLQTGSELWSRIVDARFPERQFRWKEPADWPQIVDLDRNGRPEVLVPSGMSVSTAKWSRYPWGEVEALDGATGKRIWARRVYNCDFFADRFAVGPDVNGDGRQEVYVASLWGHVNEVVVDCLSGEDGKPLWIQKHPLAASESTGDNYVATPVVWRSGRDGWPQLVVTVASFSSPKELKATLLFSAKDGRVTHTATGIHRVSSQDVDGDRVDDLCLITFREIDCNMDSGARLAIVRGVAAEPIRRLGPYLQAATDFDGDGLQDCVQSDRQRLRAFSSRDGRPLWVTKRDERLVETWVFSWETAGARAVDSKLWDFDGDQTRDILVYAQSAGPHAPLQAISGRTGRVLWKAEQQIRHFQGKPRIEVDDLNADGVAEIAYYGYSDWDIQRTGSGMSTNDGQLWLAVFSGQDGGLQWRASLSEVYGSSRPGKNLNYSFPREGHVRFAVADANRDGVRDVFVVAEPDPAPAERLQLELCACDGRNGSVLWRRPLQSGRDGHNTLFTRSATFSCEDINRDGQPELLLLELENVEDTAKLPAEITGRQAVLHVLDAGTGEPVWVRRVNVDVEFCRYEDNRSYFPRPCVLHGRDGEVRVALHLRTTMGQHRVVLFDHEGSEAGEFTYSHQSYSPDFSLVIHDCDRDGNDDFLVATSNSLLAVRAFGTIEQLMEFPTAQVSPPRVQIHSSESAQQSTLVVTNLERSEATGFNPATGSRVWHCVGPGQPPNLFPEIASTVVLAATVDEAPRVLFNARDQAICRTAAWSVADKRRASTSGRTRDRSGLRTANSLPVAKDPRLLRHLPWADSANTQKLTELWALAFHATVCSLTLLICPIAYLRLLVRHRRWTMKTLFGLPVLVGIALVVLTVPWKLPNETTGPRERLFLAVLAAAPIWFTFKLCSWPASLRWRPVVAWLVVILLSSVLAAIVLPTNLIGSIEPSLFAVPLEPGESLSLHGWYMPLLPGFYAASWVFLFALAVYVGFVRLGRRLLKTTS